MCSSFMRCTFLPNTCQLYIKGYGNGLIAHLYVQYLLTSVVDPDQEFGTWYGYKLCKLIEILIRPLDPDTKRPRMQKKENIKKVLYMFWRAEVLSGAKKSSPKTWNFLCEKKNICILFFLYVFSDFCHAWSKATWSWIRIHNAYNLPWGKEATYLTLKLFQYTLSSV